MRKVCILFLCDYCSLLILSANVKEIPSKWKIREQLVLASAVQRSGDQNWYIHNHGRHVTKLTNIPHRVSVSRCMKPLADESRAPDFYSQKVINNYDNCASNY